MGETMQPDKGSFLEQLETKPAPARTQVPALRTAALNAEVG